MTRESRGAPNALEDLPVPWTCCHVEGLEEEDGSLAGGRRVYEASESRWMLTTGQEEGHHVRVLLEDVGEQPGEANAD